MAFVGTERMTEAGTGGQICQAGVAGAAMLALVLGLLVALIQGVLPLFAPVGWRKQGPAVRLAMLEALVPQCLQ